MALRYLQSLCVLLTVSLLGSCVTSSKGTPSTDAGHPWASYEASVDVYVPPNATPESATISPSDSTMAPGDRQALTATVAWSDGTMTDATALVEWSSSDPNIVHVHATGVATAVRAGQVTVTASVKDLGSVSTTIAVSEAPLVSLALQPNSLALRVLETGSLRATGHFSDGTFRDVSTLASWSCGDSAVCATTSGKVTAKAAGSTYVTASYLGMTVTASIQVREAELVGLAVSPDSVDIRVGEAAVLKATGTFSDGSSRDVNANAIWAIDNTTVASVDMSGQVKGQKPRQATVTVSASGQIARATIAVSPVPVVGLILSPTGLRLDRGEVAQLAAVATFADGSMSQVTYASAWAVDDPTILSVTSDGQVTAVDGGTGVVSATYRGATGTVSVSVVTPSVVALTVSPGQLSLLAGSSGALSATARLSDGRQIDVTTGAQWVSQPPFIALVDGAGRVVGVSAGSATIAASYMGRTGSAEVTVTPGQGCPSGSLGDFNNCGSCGTTCAADEECAAAVCKKQPPLEYTLSSDPGYPDESHGPAGTFAVGQLTDGTYGVDYYGADLGSGAAYEWAGWLGVDPVIVMRLPATTAVDSLTIGADVWQGVGVYQPMQIRVAFSDNGTDFAGERTFTKGADYQAIVDQHRGDLVLNLGHQTTRYLRITLVAGGSWTFLDEIAVCRGGACACVSGVIGDNNNCGACGNVCAWGQQCIAAACRAPTPMYTFDSAPGYPDDAHGPAIAFTLGQLTDGTYGVNQYSADLGSGAAYEWVGWLGVDPVIVMRLPATTVVDSLTMGAAVWQGDGIYQPTEIRVAFSDNGTDFAGEITFVKGADYAAIADQLRGDMVLNLGHKTTRYLRITVVAGGSWTFLDEIAAQ